MYWGKSLAFISLCNTFRKHPVCFNQMQFDVGFQRHKFQVDKFGHASRITFHFKAIVHLETFDCTTFITCKLGLPKQSPCITSNHFKDNFEPYKRYYRLWMIMVFLDHFFHTCKISKNDNFLSSQGKKNVW